MKRFVCLFLILWALPVGFLNLAGLIDGIGAYSYGAVISIVGAPLLIVYIFPKIGFILSFVWGFLQSAIMQSDKIIRGLLGVFASGDPEKDIITNIVFGLVFAGFVLLLSLFLRETFKKDETNLSENEELSILEIYLKSLIDKSMILIKEIPNKYPRYKYVLTAIFILALVFIYPVYSYFEQDKVLYKAAERKYIECFDMKKKKYSVNSFIDSKCPEYLYYINNCDDKCRKEAIKTIKKTFK